MSFKNQKNKYRYYILFLIVGLFNLQLMGQQPKIDSLLVKLNNEKANYKRAQLLNEIGNTYRYINKDSAFKYIILGKSLSQKYGYNDQLAESYSELGILCYKKNIDSTFYFLNKAYSIAEKSTDYRGIVKSLNSIGLYKYFSRDYQFADSVFNIALNYDQEISDNILLAMLYNNVAMLYKATGRTENALTFYHKSLLLSEEENDYRGMGIMLNNIGKLYQDQNKIDLALDYLERALQIWKDRGNKNGESYVLLNLGVVYESIEDYDKALDYYRNALILKKSLNSISGQAILYNNISIIYKKLKVVDSAFFYANESLKLRLVQQNKIGEARVRINIGQLYLLQQNYPFAKKEFESARELTNDSKNYEVLSLIYSGLFRINNNTNNYEQAIECLIKSNAFKDSVFNIEKERSIANIESKYKILKKDKENLQLIKLNHDKDDRIRRFIISAIALISIIILSIVFLLITYKSKRKLHILNRDLQLKNLKINEQANVLQKTLEKLKKVTEYNKSMTHMIVHDLKTPLSTIVNVKLIKDKELGLNMVQQAGYKMMHLVQNILDVSKYENVEIKLSQKEIKFGDIIKEAIDEVRFIAEHKQLFISYAVETEFNMYADEDIFRRVLVNLLSNAVKFSPAEGKITIKTCDLDTEWKYISIFNDGPGIIIEKQKLIFDKYYQDSKLATGKLGSTGLGLTFCKMAVEAHGGEIGVKSDGIKGAEFWITMPKCLENNYMDKSFLTQKEKDYLNSFVNDLKLKRIFEVTSINKILNDIDDNSSRILKWKSMVKEAVFSGDNKLYHDLLDYKM